ncbi:MAG: glutathione S-transferase family protein [Pseudomonadota bacterium]
MELYCFPSSNNTRKVLAVVHHLGLEPAIRVVNLLERAQLDPSFVALNPNHMTPTLLDGDFVLWESNAIMQYLAASTPGNVLWPASPRLQADISRWQCWQLAHWEGQACVPLVFQNLLKGLIGQGGPDPEVVAGAERQFHRFASILEAHLRGREWLVGSSVTLADFSVASPLMLAESARLPVGDYPEIRGWYERVAALEAWRKSEPDMPTQSPSLNGGERDAVHAAHL